MSNPSLLGFYNTNPDLPAHQSYPNPPQFLTIFFYLYLPSLPIDMQAHACLS